MTQFYLATFSSHIGNVYEIWAARKGDQVESRFPKGLPLFDSTFIAGFHL